MLKNKLNFTVIVALASLTCFLSESLVKSLLVFEEATTMAEQRFQALRSQCNTHRILTSDPDGRKPSCQVKEFIFEAARLQPKQLKGAVH
jgi:hypothetical protein